MSRKFMALLATTISMSQALAASPFEEFPGSWKGRGDVLLGDGSHEAITCKARYAVGAGGNSLNIAVRCVSDSFKVDLISNVVAQGDAFTGSWQERERQIQGDVSGRIPVPGTMQASLQTLGGGMQLGARSDGRRQVITIRSQGSDIQGVTIALRKR